MPAVSPDLRAELNGAEKDGPEHDKKILGQVTNLFLSNVDHLNESQIAAVDGVLHGKLPDLLNGQLARDALSMCSKECESVKTGKIVAME